MNNSSIDSFRHMIKMLLFVKLDIFNIQNMDEFFQVWVLTDQNSFIRCKITSVIPETTHCNDLLTSTNSIKITYIKTINFQLRNFKFENFFMEMTIWFQNVFWTIEVIKSLPKTFLVTYYEVFFIIHNFFWKLSKPYLPKLPPYKSNTM